MSGTELKTQSGAPVPPLSTAFTPTTQSQVSGLNTTLKIGSQLDVQDSNHLLQKLQGPVMYGAVAGCAGLLLLVVVVVVVLKKTSNRLVLPKPSRKQELLSQFLWTGGTDVISVAFDQMVFFLLQGSEFSCCYHRVKYNKDARPS